MDRSISAVVFMILAFSACLNVQCCENLPTPVIEAYDDGWIRFTIPPVPENTKKYGIEYEIYKGDELVENASNNFWIPNSSGDKFAVRKRGVSPLGNRIKYVMYEGDWSNRTCEAKSKVFTITALLPSESNEK